MGRGGRVKNAARGRSDPLGERRLCVRGGLGGGYLPNELMRKGPSKEFCRGFIFLKFVATIFFRGALYFLEEPYIFWRSLIFFEKKELGFHS
jgi:hypothetical protein